MLLRAGIIGTEGADVNEAHLHDHDPRQGLSTPMRAGALKRTGR
jgi:hypothetical protein